MKLTRRRETPAADPAPAVPLADGPRADEPGAGADAAPPGTVATTYAEVLDGRRLWLAAAAESGRLALRDAAGTLVPLVDETAADPPAGTLSARLDLSGLPDTSAPRDAADPAETDSVYDLVWVRDPHDPLPLWAPPGAARPDPPWTHDAAGRSVRHTLVQGGRGRLRLRTVALPPAATLVAVSLGPPGTAHVDLQVRSPGATEPVSALLLVPTDDGPDGPPLLTLPVTDERARLDAGDMADLPARLAVVLAVVDGHRLPVRRRAGDLSAPGLGAPLPELTRDDGDGAGVEPLVRLRWSSRALLQARLLGGSS